MPHVNDVVFTNYILPVIRHDIHMLLHWRDKICYFDTYV